MKAHDKKLKSLIKAKVSPFFELGFKESKVVIKQFTEMLMKQELKWAKGKSKVKKKLL